MLKLDCDLLQLSASQPLLRKPELFLNMSPVSPVFHTAETVRIGPKLTSFIKYFGLHRHLKSIKNLTLNRLLSFYL